MKKLLFLFLFFICAAGAVIAEQEDELIIEMSGEHFAKVRQAPSMWNKNARQLLKQWRGKTREKVLRDMPVVSNRDLVLHGKNTEYALVEYQDGQDFRKFLFKAENPQTLLTVAATPADVLAVNKKYGINIGLTQTAFEGTYAANAHTQNQEVLENNEVLYELSYTDVNTPKAQNNWFLFKDGQLTQTFYTQVQKDALVKDRQDARASEEAQMQADLEAAKQASTQDTTKNNPPQKALLSGGTAYDQAYMPRVINPNPFLMQGTSSDKKK